MIRYAMVALMLAGTAAVAQEHASALVEKRICRATTPTGTIMSTSVCKTRRELALMDAHYEDDAAKARHNNTVEYSQGKGNRIEP